MQLSHCDCSCVNRDLRCHAAISYDDDRGTAKQRSKERERESEENGRMKPTCESSGKQVRGPRNATLQAATTITITITSDCFASWPAKSKITNRVREREREREKEK